MPFTRPEIPCDNRSDYSAEDKRTTETVQHARLINDRHKSLTEIDIETAEATAKMINAGKILSGLLVYLTSSKHRAEGAVKPTQPQKIEEKLLQPKDTPSSAAPKRLRIPALVNKVQGLEQISGNKGQVSHTDNDCRGMTVTTSPTHGEDRAPEDTPAMRKCLLDESNTTIGSSKGGKASKKNKQSRKHIVNERMRPKVLSAVSAYPTQRPPRKKLARKSTTIKESLPEEKLGSEERDSERVQTTEEPTKEGSDHDDHKEVAPEPSLAPEEASKKDHASLESSSEGHQESEYHTPEETFDREWIASDVRLLESNVFDGGVLIESSSEGHDEFDFHTPVESFDQEWIAADHGLLSGDFFDSEDLTATTDIPMALSLYKQPIQDFGFGAQSLIWAYTTDATVDEALSNAGVWLWSKPITHFRAQHLQRIRRYGHSALAPVIVSHERTEKDEPIIYFDGCTVLIVPHEQCWEDIRSDISHPDFLVPSKLAEYQACEAAGYQIWRHDRDLLRCRKLSCGAAVSDYGRSTVICFGCGPKSVVRYCSLQHQLEDVDEHSRECGTWKLVFKRVIDHTTAPSKFARMFPAIKRRHGCRTAALYRQRLFSALTYGRYTLFDSAFNGFEILYWPKQDPKWREMDRRIERLLNIVFLDSGNHVVLGYLYRLLRELLRSQNQWFESTEQILKRQFESEFSNYKANTYWRNGEAPCQCEWFGKVIPRWDHLSTCRWHNSIADDSGPVCRPKCLEATVEEYEARFWILRAWRQQHPTQNDWRLRAAGYGFPNTVPDEECYKLGAGWTGWGGVKDNICD